jgi:L-ribulokinase
VALAYVAASVLCVEAAQARMTGVKDIVYRPSAANAATYQRLYPLYKTLHDAFGRADFNGSLAGLMKQLIAIRDEVRRTCV